MNRTEAAKGGRGRGCLRAFGVGCAVVVVLVLAAGFFAWLNRDAIRGSDWYRSLSDKAAAAKTEVGNMLQLRADLLAEYPAEEIEVLNEQLRTSDGRQRSLVVQFTNPAFEMPGDAAEQSTAREIALTVAGRYPEVERFDFIKVKFVSQRVVGVRVTRTDPYAFPTAELLDEIAPGDSATSPPPPATRPTSPPRASDAG